MILSLLRGEIGIEIDLNGFTWESIFSAYVSSLMVLSSANNTVK